MPPLSSPSALPDATAPVAVIGDAYIDELFDRGRRTASSHVGGSGLAVATDLALLGVPCVLISSIGDDPEGARIRAHLAEHDVRFLPTVGRHPTGVVRSVHARGRTESRYDEATRLRRIEFDDEQLAAIGLAPVVAVAGFAFDDKKQQRRLLAAVRQPQNRLIVDPNPREGLFNDREKFRANFERHASSALLVHLGSGDADLIFRSPIDEVTSELLDLGAANIVATEGRGGARWVNRTGIDVASPAARMGAPIVDTLGAGDAVLAVTVASIVRDGLPTRGLQARAVLDRAMALAGATIRHTGATLQDVDEVPPLVRNGTARSTYRLLDQSPRGR